MDLADVDLREGRFLAFRHDQNGAVVNTSHNNTDFVKPQKKSENLHKRYGCRSPSDSLEEGEKPSRSKIRQAKRGPSSCSVERTLYSISLNNTSPRSSISRSEKFSRYADGPPPSTCAPNPRPGPKPQPKPRPQQPRPIPSVCPPPPEAWPRSAAQSASSEARTNAIAQFSK
ncbi:hypothetical protein GJ744_000307 [Endocarpon pusillum]|uniref:Uncharacterized protein n=1 Tax=Endocarpon pusillum TaxID=364733 RepID=A0A8H7E8U9_9EURO|nr:hypothetical protein GJ744_000307 [Endocarpon pusillum]